jgi:hypothetical protein
VSSSSPISPALDHLADLALWEAELAADPAGADNPIRPGRGRPDVTTDLVPIDASGAGRIR